MALLVVLSCGLIFWISLGGHQTTVDYDDSGTVWLVNQRSSATAYLSISDKGKIQVGNLFNNLTDIYRALGKIGEGQMPKEKREHIVTASVDAQYAFRVVAPQAARPFADNVIRVCQYTNAYLYM